MIMSLSVFADKTAGPDDGALASALGDSMAMWSGLTEILRSTYDNVSGEWKFYSKEAGWTFVVKTRKRTILYLIPLNNYFKVNFVFGAKAIDAAQNADIPSAVIQTMIDAHQYAEGRSFMFDVKNEKDVETAMKLARIKNDN